MEDAVKKLFDHYEHAFKQGLAGNLDPRAVSRLYASEFIAASPAGVTAGKNDDALIRAMTDGYAHYRDIGTQSMDLRGVRISPIDEAHCVAHVAWRATYQRDDLPKTDVDFEVHYLVQIRDGAAKVFGWVAGDEEALLRQRGII